MVLSSLRGAAADWSPLKVCTTASALLGPFEHREKGRQGVCACFFPRTNSYVMCVLLALLHSLAITVFVVVIARAAGCLLPNASD